MPFINIETYFSQAPEAKIRRSSFKYNLPVKFTMNGGDLVPFMCEEVLPGDTFDLKLSKVVRLSSSIHPTMDNIYLDTYFFYIPTRFLWDHWINFNGENDKAWAQQVNYVPPKITLGSSTDVSIARFGVVQPQSILNYLMSPAFTEDSVKALDVLLYPLNAYIKVWNDWFRSENLADECPMYTGDGRLPVAYFNAYTTFMNNTFGVNNNFVSSDSCLKVAKFADYFTRSLPQPQKGSDVLIPAAGEVLYNPDGFDNSLGGTPRFVVGDTGANVTSGGTNSITGAGDILGTADNKYLGYDPKGTLSLQGLEITVNNLRLAVQTQKLLEKDAMSGSRYIEAIRSHFGVISPDLRLQRSEYLGGKRTLINMSEVIQTSETTSSSPLGQLAGRSLTTGIEDSFIKSFTEHGILLGLCCIRPDRTYSQGIEKKWTRFERLDYYYPVLAHLGYMPIKEHEIFLPKKAETVDPTDVFGYQEAWSEYRTQRGRNVGYMQPGISGSLASWTYADEYSSSPYLSSQWLYQGKNEIDRTLAVPSSTAPQFICDFLVYGKYVRPMPVHSIPGLMDHF